MPTPKSPVSAARTRRRPARSCDGVGRACGRPGRRTAPSGRRPALPFESTGRHRCSFFVASPPIRPGARTERGGKRPRRPPGVVTPPSNAGRDRRSRENAGLATRDAVLWARGARPRSCGPGLAGRRRARSAGARRARRTHAGGESRRVRARARPSGRREPFTSRQADGRCQRARGGRERQRLCPVERDDVGRIGPPTAETAALAHRVVDEALVPAERAAVEMHDVAGARGVGLEAGVTSNSGPAARRRCPGCRPLGHRRGRVRGAMPRVAALCLRAAELVKRRVELRLAWGRGSSSDRGPGRRRGRRPRRPRERPARDVVRGERVRAELAGGLQQGRGT